MSTVWASSIAFHSTASTAVQAQPKVLGTRRIPMLSSSAPLIGSCTLACRATTSAHKSRGSHMPTRFQSHRMNAQMNAIIQLERIQCLTRSPPPRSHHHLQHPRPPQPPSAPLPQPHLQTALQATRKEAAALLFHPQHLDPLRHLMAGPQS